MINELSRHATEDLRTTIHKHFGSAPAVIACAELVRRGHRFNVPWDVSESEVKEFSARVAEVIIVMQK